MSRLHNVGSLSKAEEDDTLDIITYFSDIWPMISDNLLTLSRCDNISSFT